MTTAAGGPQSPWTDEQSAAIQMRDVSIALSAGAGCGKTFVLTERFLAHFDSGNPQALGADDLAVLRQIDWSASDDELYTRVTTNKAY